MADAGKYIRALMALRQDAIPGRWPAETNRVAPHKPLLLISVLDDFLEQPRKPNLIEPTLQLENRFDAYWKKVIAPSHETTLALPFFHLKNDGFWHLTSLAGIDISMEAPVEVRKSAAALRRFVRGAKLDDELYRLVIQPCWSQHLRSVLVVAHFAPELHHCFMAET